VKERSWPLLDESLTELKGLAEKIEKRDDQRHRSFRTLKGLLGMVDGEPFRQMINELPEEHRGDLERLFRQLQGSVSKVRTLSGGLFYFFRSVQDSINQILNEVFPYRKGRLYSKRGRSRPPREESVVVDQKG
jgi:hypothetical protein